MIASLLTQVGLLSVTIIPAVLVAFTLWCRRAIVHPSRRALERAARPAIRPAPARNVIQGNWTRVRVIDREH